MNTKTKVKIRMAVKDYQEMFPEEYRDLLIVIENQRQNLKNEYAEFEGTHAIKRALFTISEKLSQMIGMKLSEDERQMFRDKEAQRWFCKEFPQFAITKEV